MVWTEGDGHAGSFRGSFRDLSQHSFLHLAMRTSKCCLSSEDASLPSARLQISTRDRVVPGMGVVDMVMHAQVQTLAVTRSSATRIIGGAHLKIRS